jgi:DNA-binding winged helix-turn-helix (wHTH) protein
MKDMKNRIFRFDNVEIDVPNLRVTVNSEIRPLEPKSFRLLLFLLENPGRALTKDEIMSVVWPDAFVSDNSLARAVTQIRKVLEDDPKAPKYIETVPTVGYRFVGECEEKQMPPGEPDHRVANTEVHRYRWAAITAASIAFGVLAIGTVSWMRGPAGPASGSRSAVLKNTTFSQLTDQPGQELYPRLMASRWSMPAGPLGTGTSTRKESAERIPQISPRTQRRMTRSQPSLPMANTSLFVLSATAGESL